MDLLAQVILNGTAAGSAYALVAVALSLNHSTHGFANFGLGGVATACVYVFVVVSETGAGVVVAAAVAIVMAAVSGALVELSMQRVARTRRVPVPAQLIGSLGLLIAVESAIAGVAGSHTRVANVPVFGATLIAGPLRITVTHVVTFAVAIAVTLLVSALLYRTVPGRRFRAVAADPLLANCFGISAHNVTLVATVICAVLLTIASILIGSDTGVTPTMGFPILLIGLVALFLGGTSSIGGAFAAGLLLGILQHATALFFSGQWQDFVVYVILLFVLRYRPLGLWGVRTRRSPVTE